MRPTSRVFGRVARIQAPNDPAAGIAGFAVFWTAHAPLQAYGGLALAGIGMGLHFPIAITRAIGFSGGRPDLATSYTSLGSGLATGLGPFALGFLADRVGSHTALLAVPCFAALGIVGTLASRRPRRTGLVAAVVIGDLPTTIG